MAEMANDADENQDPWAQLRHLTKTDPDPRVRRRAHALVVVADGSSLAGAAGCSIPPPIAFVSGRPALPPKAARDW